MGVLGRGSALHVEFAFSGLSQQHRNSVFDLAVVHFEIDLKRRELICVGANIHAKIIATNNPSRLRLHVTLASDVMKSITSGIDGCYIMYVFTC